MEPESLEPEKDSGKALFQQELNKWFESRGIITNLRSHLRHLMVTALQGTQIGERATEGNSPKAQALNLMIAEYLFRHNCHYTLSVFTSEVPTLANFNPGVTLREKRRSGADSKFSEEICFRDNEIEEIFNALGMSSREEELTLLKVRYLEKGNKTSLVELFLQAVVEMSTKLHIRQNLESLAVKDGERLLSKKWSAEITDILLAEKLALPHITAMEGAIFRITEREVRRIIEEKRKWEMQMLTNREKRIQEHLRKHEDEILLRLMEAEKDLMTRKGIINEELTERQKHLTRMAVEWNNKHEEILRLSKNFHKMENENRGLQKKLREIEEENNRLKTQKESQNNTMDEMREELNSFIAKLKEVTDSNVALREQIQTLIGRENKTITLRPDGACQETERANSEEIPLLWSKNIATDDHICTDRGSQKEFESNAELKDLPGRIQGISLTERQPITEPTESQFQRNNIKTSKELMNLNSVAEEDDSSVSFSSDEITVEVRKKLLDLEEETNRINQNYLEYKLKCISTDSSSESLPNECEKLTPNINENARVIKETKFCQTVNEDTFTKIQKLKERKEKNNFESALTKKPEASPRLPAKRVPTTRQLQNRDFFLKNRKLLHELEKQNLEDLQMTSPSIVESPTFSSAEEFTQSLIKANKMSPKRSVLMTPLRTASFYCNEEPRIPTLPINNNNKNMSSVNSPEKLSKGDMEMDAGKRLALLEEARIKSPQISARKPLRQQILLSESEKDSQEKILNCKKSTTSSPESPCSEKMSDTRKSINESFW